MLVICVHCLTNILENLEISFALGFAPVARFGLRHPGGSQAAQKLLPETVHVVCPPKLLVNKIGMEGCNHLNIPVGIKSRK